MNNSAWEKVKRFLKAEDGPTIVEYAILLALLASMMIAAIVFVSSEAVEVSNSVVDGMDEALNN